MGVSVSGEQGSPVGGGGVHEAVSTDERDVPSCSCSSSIEHFHLSETK